MCYNITQSSFKFRTVFAGLNKVFWHFLLIEQGLEKFEVYLDYIITIAKLFFETEQKTEMYRIF